MWSEAPDGAPNVASAQPRSTPNFLLPGKAVSLADGAPFSDRAFAAMAAGMPCVAVTGTQGSARLAEVTSALVPCLDASLLDL